MNVKRVFFFKHRYVYFAISIAVILTGVIFTLVNGLQLDIKFKGGTILNYSCVGDVDVTKAESVIGSTLGQTVDCQIQTNITNGGQTLVINLAGNEGITSQDQQTVTQVLTVTFPDANMNLTNSQTVEPSYGARFFKNGMIAIALSFILILIYVGIRFRNIGGFSAGAMAIVALIHDVLVVTSVFAIFQIPVGDSYIAAVLTIIGFSINDTIVIYDRIRENARLLGKKVNTEELVDISITQSISRSINTNITVFVSITIVFIFAQIYNITSIRTFALPMMFGTISGCYSTVCIAGPLWTMWKNYKSRKRAARA
ncbi:protein translocase subunit SecF [Papillibacter cinnamivorans]|uniref:Protein-export membrane protein SecF n=1 Tax=Papillibacter cinnamivorans DSM 12816 TaxID=1122930 RepID=A0A1W1ZNY8_9FIRM|nr:protein translocase subunit SecF [Papillibacter cinnamivorans]SMC50255.1 preprotein translocase subunit SecF [Papillibacter cinnamivorans DSM 12816]